MHKHVRNVEAHKSAEFSEAACTCRFSHLVTGAICPRHQPVAYTDCMARHATDSIR